jgi:hypothetical protein
MSKSQIEFSIKIIENLIERVKLRDAGINPMQGDCGNFAMALKEILELNGGVKFACSYANFLYARDGEPAHCGLVWRGYFWDIRGRRDIKTARSLLKDRCRDGYIERYDEIVVEMDIPEEYRPIKGIFDRDRYDIVKKMLWIEFLTLRFENQ